MEIFGIAVKSVAAAIAFAVMLCALAIVGTVSGVIGLAASFRD